MAVDIFVAVTLDVVFGLQLLRKAASLVFPSVPPVDVHVCVVFSAGVQAPPVTGVVASGAQMQASIAAAVLALGLAVCALQTSSRVILLISAPNACSSVTLVILASGAPSASVVIAALALSFVSSASAFCAFGYWSSASLASSVSAVISSWAIAFCRGIFMPEISFVIAEVSLPSFLKV
ncbi:uncharacterized protein TEOVI_000659400 [Trypanosoma equiperdum]|uniref:Uncharacterized protein n=1 Tax=Trypanosoma equiperdum TaxID=5694 RepID=A0A1G4I6A1_TRYEQ|nr:hypothetical protein TEOVI_000659400 [Trypanosoma equiperdum]